VNNNPNATQAVVDAAKADLQTAIDEFSVQKITGIAATGIKFSTSLIAIKLGESLTLSYILVPANATAPELVWSSSDTTAVTIDQNGKITAVGTGSSTIMVAFKNDPTKNTKIYVNATVGIAEIDENKPEVYPNITSDVVYIKKAGFIKSIQIIATNSKKVKECKPKADVVIIDVTDLIGGTYYIILENEDGSIITKTFIKE
jgi:uncharacterized protein YjdB